SRGGDDFTYTISAGRCGSASAWVSVNIFATAAPLIALTAPTNHATFTPGALVTNRANVSPSDFSGKVEFYRGGFKLGQATNAPYEITWTAAYDPSLASSACDDITAIATDRFGQIGSTNACITVS